MNFYINNLTNYTYYKMEKVERIGQLNAKYDEIFPQYFEMLMRYKENPDDLENKKVFNYLQSNIKYIEKYLSLLQFIDGDEMDKALEKNNFIKGLTDTLFEHKKNNDVSHDPNIEVVQENYDSSVQQSVDVGTVD